MSREIKFISKILEYGTVVTVVLSFMICQLFGRYSEAIILFSLLTLAGLSFTRLKVFGVLGFVSVMGFAMMTAQSSMYSVLFPIVLILLVRCALFFDLNNSGHPSACLISVIAGLLVFGQFDRDWAAFFLVVFASTVPIRKYRCFKKNRLKELLVCGVFAGLVPCGFILYHKMKELDKSAILKVGAWAKVDDRLDTLDDINLAKMYSYSEMKEILQADSLQITDLSDEYSEAWAIIPTIPFSKEQSAHVIKWVKNGGHLVLVTDHTDLFGHATVINKTLSGLCIETQTDAFFPQDPSSTAQVSLQKNIPLKTANTQQGVFLWPFMTARWVSEPVDYSNRNFFGPMRATKNADFGRRVIAGSVALGKGEITMFGDSTIFANFAIYQPGVISFLEYLRKPKVMAFLYPYMLLLIVLGLIFAKFFNFEAFLISGALVGCWAVCDLSIIPIKWPDHVFVSGDPKMLSEWANPAKSFSTAYSLIPLSGKKPRWVEQVPSNSNCLWVSSLPPPEPSWVWVSANFPSGLENRQDDSIRGFDELLVKITSHKPVSWQSYYNNDCAEHGSIWTNDVMGEWWFDHGISQSKKARFDSWVSFIKREELKSPQLSHIQVSSQKHVYRFKSEAHDWVTLCLPKIDLKNVSEVYFGRGVSAKVVTLADGRQALFGTKSMTEGWNVVSSWIIIPD